MTLEQLSNLKKKDISEEHIVDTWLFKYHNTTLKEIEKDFKKDKNGQFLTGESKKFYKKYEVTQKQHDEWVDEIKVVLKKKFNISKKMFERSFPWTYLNTAPSIKK